MVPRVVRNFIEEESRTVIARGWGRVNGESVFDGYKFSAGEDEKVVKMDGGEGCTVMPSA